MFFYVCYAVGQWRIVGMDRLTCTVTLAVFMVVAFLFLWLVFRTRDEWEPLLLSVNAGLISRAQDFNNLDIVGFYICRPMSKSSHL